MKGRMESGKFPPKTPDTSFSMSTALIALELQPPYSKLIIDGIKLIETRRYKLPQHLLYQPILLLQSTKGIDAVSALPDQIEANDDSLSILGEIFIEEVFQYNSIDQYNEDRNLHCVPLDSSYNYVEGCELFGWRISSVVKYDKEMNNPKLKRFMRSLFSVVE